MKKTLAILLLGIIALSPFGTDYRNLRAEGTVSTTGSSGEIESGLRLTAGIVTNYKVMGFFTPLANRSEIRGYKITVSYPDLPPYSFSVPANVSHFTDWHSKQNTKNTYSVTAVLDNGNLLLVANTVELFMGPNGENMSSSGTKLPYAVITTSPPVLSPAIPVPTQDSPSVPKPTPAPTTPTTPVPPVAPVLSSPLALPISKITDHPRLFLNSKDLPRLRGWAIPTNPIYQQGLLKAILDAENTYNTLYFPKGIKNTKWPDPGNITWQTHTTEVYAQRLAFASLVDPDPAKRIKYAKMSRNLLMHIMDEAAKGFVPRINGTEGVPYRDQQFSIGDRSRIYGEAFGLTVDWLQASDVLTKDDKRTIQKVFLLWADNIRSNGRAAPPKGIRNDPSLVGKRWAANNYYSGQVRNLTLMALSLDPADDRPVDPQKGEAIIGNTLRSYLNDVFGTYLYQQYSIYGNPEEASRDLKIPITAKGLGDAGGGMSPESSLYGSAMGFVYQGLLAIHTAGYDSEAVAGPQIKLITSDYWEKFVDGVFQTSTPQSKKFSERKWLGNIYQVAGYGDMLRTWITPGHVGVLGPIGLYDADTGNAKRLGKVKWILLNMIEGGEEKMYSHTAVR